MSDEWRLRGQIDHISISQVVFAPGYDLTGKVVAASPAGLNISHDRGEKWFAPPHGTVGLFARDVACASGGVILASSPGGLFVSRDAGLTWETSLPEQELGTLLFTCPECFLACSESDGTVWRGNLERQTLQKVGELPHPATQLIQTEGEIVAISGDLYRSSDDGSTWHPLDLSIDGSIELVAATGKGGLAVATAEPGLWLVPAEGDAIFPEE